MNTSVTITQGFNDWRLNIVVVHHDGEIKVTTMPYIRLIDAIDAANTMGLHIDNLDDLALTQYKVLRDSA